MNASELKPCPFCGQAVGITAAQWHELPDLEPMIVCDCGAMMYLGAQAEELAAAWNRRPVENAAMQALVSKYAQPVEGHYLSAVRNLLIAFVAEARQPETAAGAVLQALAEIEHAGRALAGRLVAAERPQEAAIAATGPTLSPTV